MDIKSECIQATPKHDACNGDAWQLDEDAPADCPCECHDEPFGTAEREVYRLCDIDNRDEDGAPHEFTAPTLAAIIPYIDGAVRADVVFGARDHVDAAVDALCRENYELARQHLREIGCYLTLETINE